MPDESQLLTKGKTSVGGEVKGLGESGNVYTGGQPTGGSGVIQSGGETFIPRDPLNQPGTYQKVGEPNTIYISENPPETVKPETKIEPGNILIRYDPETGVPISYNPATGVAPAGLSEKPLWKSQQEEAIGNILTANKVPSDVSYIDTSKLIEKETIYITPKVQPDIQPNIITSDEIGDTIKSAIVKSNIDYGLYQANIEKQTKQQKKAYPATTWYEEKIVSKVPENPVLKGLAEIPTSATQGLDVIIGTIKNPKDWTLLATEKKKIPSAAKEIAKSQFEYIGQHPVEAATTLLGTVALGYVLPKAIPTIKSSVIKTGDFALIKTKATGIEVPIGKNLVLTETGAESTGIRQPFVKIPIADKLIKLKPEQVKVFSNQVSLATSEKSVGQNIFTAVSKKGQTSSGITTIKAIKEETLRNPLLKEEVQPAKVGTRTITKEKTTKEYGPSQSIKYAEKEVPATIADYREGLKIATGTITRKNIAGISLSKKGLDISDTTLYGGFKPSEIIMKSPGKSGVTAVKTDTLTVTPEIASRSAMETVSQTPKTNVPVILQSPQLTKAHFSTVGTIMEKAEEPVVKIKRKQSTEVASGFTPVVAIRQTTERKQVMGIAEATQAAEKLAQATPNKESTFPILAPQALGKFEIQAEKTGQRLTPVLSLKQITSQITNITPRTYEPVEPTPRVPVGLIPGFNFPRNEDKSSKRRNLYGIAWKYSEKKHPIATPKEVWEGNTKIVKSGLDSKKIAKSFSKGGKLW